MNWKTQIFADEDKEKKDIADLGRLTQIRQRRRKRKIFPQISADELEDADKDNVGAIHELPSPKIKIFPADLSRLTQIRKKKDFLAKAQSSQS